MTDPVAREAAQRPTFDAWIADLDERVIQEEFGYERGEFTVFPELWQPLYDEGLTPDAAWQRALDRAEAERAEQDRLRAENYERIKAEDKAYVERGMGETDCNIT